jgi:hypothetical protein
MCLKLGSSKLALAVTWSEKCSGRFVTRAGLMQQGLVLASQQSKVFIVLRALYLCKGFFGCVT